MRYDEIPHGIERFGTIGGEEVQVCHGPSWETPQVMYCRRDGLHHDLPPETEVRLCSVEQTRRIQVLDRQIALRLSGSGAENARVIASLRVERSALFATAEG